MATRIEPPKARTLYDEDFYVWAEVQAELLRARRFAELDLENLVEEVADLGDAKKSAVLSNASVIIEHLLKLAHSRAADLRPATDPRNGWRASVREHRRRLHFALTPRLRQILQEQLAEVYALARADAAAALRDHGEDAAADALPDACAYTLDQITTDWWP